uniref:Uncharacterized protein n=1 Tax=Oryza nivara TaxID=4536 RepID=A0A0E0FKN5_ORYNI
MPQPITARVLSLQGFFTLHRIANIRPLPHALASPPPSARASCRARLSLPPSPAFPVRASREPTRPFAPSHEAPLIRLGDRSVVGGQVGAMAIRAARWWWGPESRHAPAPSAPPWRRRRRRRNPSVFEIVYYTIFLFDFSCLSSNKTELHIIGL